MSSGTSYNGWPANSDPHAIDVQPFGDAYGLPFPGGVRGGDVATVLGYVATQLHYRVEPCVAGWDWGYEYRANVNNPSSLSCHASATAIDWNAPDHPNGARGTFTGAQVGVIRQILAEVQGAVQWGGDYTGTADEMHFEIIVNATTLARVAAELPDNPDTDGGFLMALTDDEQRKLADNVQWLRDQLDDGTAEGQESVGGTIAATLTQAQANYNLFEGGVGQGQNTVGQTIAATLAQVQANANSLNP